jgi:hypothetical protein
MKRQHGMEMREKRYAVLQVGIWGPTELIKI